MSAENKLRWSDVCVLVATYWCGLNGHSRLKHVIAAADTINHAILNYEELSSALVRLEQHGLIVVGAAPWSAKCTKKGKGIVKPIADKNTSAFRVWEEAEKKLGVAPWVPKEPLPHSENYLRYPGFTEEIYQKEANEYLADMGEDV